MKRNSYLFSTQSRNLSDFLDEGALYNYKYAIFDMDGTLIDSMPYWDSLGRNYLAGKGIHATEEDLAPIDTMTLLESSAYFKQKFGLSETPGVIMGEMNALMNHYYEQEIPLKPGARECLEALHKSGVRMCIATATDLTLAEDCLMRLGVRPLFDFIVSCETIGKSKKFPDIYQLAEKKFKEKVFNGENSPDQAAIAAIMPADIAVYEDESYCIRTAKNAGFYTIAIYDSYSASAWKENSRIADEAYRSWDEALQSLLNNKHGGKE